MEKPRILENKYLPEGCIILDCPAASFYYIIFGDGKINKIPKITTVDMNELYQITGLPLYPPAPAQPPAEGGQESAETSIRTSQEA